MKLIKYLIIAEVIFFFNKPLLAQSDFSETAIYQVTYKFIHAYDTLDLEKKQVANMNLYVGQSYSLYRYVGYELYQKELMKLQDQVSDWIKTSDMSKPMKSGYDNRHQVPTIEIFKKLDDNTSYKKESLLFKDYVVEDDIPKIQWKITSETKLFGEVKGQKAEGSFGGRIYTAWFAPQFPFRAGPWKLSGLPGIILEVSDEKKQVGFYFTSFERLKNENQILIALPKKYFKTNEAQFEKLKTLSKEDPIAFVTSMNAQLGLTVTVDGKSLESLYNGKPRAKSTKPLINNPLELTQK